MPMQIEGGSPLEVADVINKRLQVAAFAEEAIQDASDSGNAYVVYSTYSATGGQRVISFKNTSSSLHAHIVGILAGNDADTLWELEKVTAGTGAGTVVVERNLNFAFADNAPADSFGNAEVTGTTARDVRMGWYSLAHTTPFIIPLGGGMRLDENQELTITADASGIVAVALIVFFS